MSRRRVTDQDTEAAARLPTYAEVVQENAALHRRIEQITNTGIEIYEKAQSMVAECEDAHLAQYRLLRMQLEDAREEMAEKQREIDDLWREIFALRLRLTVDLTSGSALLNRAPMQQRRQRAESREYTVVDE
jgi:predicted RNase H-like nuclease (RuvC/YqgF family)